MTNYIRNVLLSWADTTMTVDWPASSNLFTVLTTLIDPF